MIRFVLLSALIISVFIIGSSFAGIPHLINYQGMLTQSGGITPVPDGQYDLTFKIYGSESDYDSLWREYHTSVDVANGLFNVILGSISSLDLSFDTDYWLGIRVGTDPELSPRTRLTSVGYAYRARVADSAVVATPSSGSHWMVSDSILYTNKYWGIARGGAGNALYGDSANTMVNLGVACTTGTPGQDYWYSTIGGGYGNLATGYFATVGGGLCNIARGGQSVVCGGGKCGADSNSARGNWSIIGCGYGNIANGTASVVMGGLLNTASASYSTIAGGTNNEASGYESTVCGGEGNKARGGWSVVSGGGGNSVSDSNVAIGDWSAVPGGRRNVAKGNYSFAAGRRAQALHHGTFVWTDSTDSDFASTGNNQFLIRASGGVGIGTNNPQQQLHVVGITRFDLSSGQIHISTPGGWPGFIAFSPNGNRRDITYNNDGLYIAASSSASAPSPSNGINILESGDVGIGITSPNYKLDVNGDINIVGSYNIKKGGTNYTHPDYVFEPDYKLMSLDQLREYVFENKCLPNVISAEDVKKNDGFKMDELMIQMLEKIEEQTLYIFQLEERIAELEKKQIK